VSNGFGNVSNLKIMVWPGRTLPASGRAGTTRISKKGSAVRRPLDLVNQSGSNLPRHTPGRRTAAFPAPGYDRFDPPGQFDIRRSLTRCRQRLGFRDEPARDVLTGDGADAHIVQVGNHTDATTAGQIHPSDPIDIGRHPGPG